MLAAKLWQQKHIVKLSEDNKIILLQLLGKRNNWNLYVSLIIIVVFVIIILFELMPLNLTLLFFTIANLLAIAIPMNINYNKLVKAGFPLEFTNNYIITSGLRIIGTIVIFSYLLLENN